MIYYKKEDIQVYKYNVTFDKEKIIELRNEIIDNCSEVIHRETKNTFAPTSKIGVMEIRNLNKKKIDIISKNDYYPDEILYQYTYDEYVYPYLITIIDNLLIGNAKYIDELSIKNIDREKLPIKDAIELAITEIKYIHKGEDSEIINKKLEELETLLIKKITINNSEKSLLEYYDRVYKLFNFEYVDSMSIEKFRSVMYFFEQK